jgi:hypothetical protein
MADTAGPSHRALPQSASPPAVPGALALVRGCALASRTAGTRPIGLLARFLGADGGPARWP